MSLPLELVLHAARQLGIDPSSPSQAHLLAVAKAYLELPLPTFYKRVIDERGQLFFLDRRTSQAFPEHPQLKQLHLLVSALAANPPSGYEKQTCMLLTRDDGSVYVHDFIPDEIKLKPAEPSAAPSAAEEPPAGPPQAPVEPAADTAAESGAEVAAEEGTTASSGADPTAANPSSSETAPEPATTEPPAATPTAGPVTAVAVPPPSLQGARHASISSTTVPGQEPHMVCNLPRDLLCSFGLLPPAPTLEVAPPLRFYSWWYEDAESSDLGLRVSGDSSVGGGVRRRYVTLDYDMSSQVFSMHSANDDLDLVIPGGPAGAGSLMLSVLTKTGAPAEVWDLHVGATLRVLGRPMTLLKADGETCTWIERHSRILLQLKSELLAELQKYKPRSTTTALPLTAAAAPRRTRGATSWGGAGYRCGAR